MKLSNFLKPYRVEHIVQDDTNYRQVTISKNHGISFRGEKLGKNIGRKRQFIIDLKKHPNTILFTRQGVLDGAIGIAPPEVDECIVTENMPMMSVDTDIIEMAYLKKLLLSEYLYEKIRLLTVVGSAQKSIHERDLLNIEIQIPSIAIQQITNKKFNTLDAEHDHLETELTHQQTLLKKLRQQILQEAIEGKLTQDWRAKNTSSPLRGTPLCQGESYTTPPLRRGGAEGGGVKKLNNLPHLKTFRKSLRKNLTPAEAKLWTLIKGKQLKGRKFRRQHSVANYILDFYCPAENLAIELDGEVHNHPQAAEYDRDRDTFLAHTGIKVLRFENKLVFENPDGLLESVEQEFNPSAPAGHLPLSGEEFEFLPSSPPVKGEYREAGRGFEPASELLKRIQTEKQQLIKDKKIKNQKPLPAITEEEKPFGLPDEWIWLKIEYFLDHKKRGMITGPFGTALQKSEHQSKGIPVFGIETIKNGQFTYKNKIFVTLEKAEELSSFGAEPGDIIISRSGTIDEICVIPVDAESGLISTNLLKVSLVEELVDSTYFCYLFRGCVSVLDKLKELCSGSTRLFLNQKILKSLLFPLPPLQEQKAIVAKVEKLLSLCDQLETQISHNQTHANQLMQAVLKEAFSQA